MLAAISFLGFIGAFVFLVLTIFSAARQDGKAKKRLYVMVGLLTVSVTSMVIASIDDSKKTVPTSSEQQPNIDNKQEEVLETIGIGVYQFKHFFNQAGKSIGFSIKDEDINSVSKSDLIESFKVNLIDDYHITMDVDRQTDEITNLLLVGQSNQNEEDVRVLINLMDTTIAGVDQSLTEDERKQIIGQLGFDTEQIQDIWSLDKNTVKNGLAYSFISTKDGEVALSIGKSK